MGNSASSQGSSTGTHDGDVGSSISEEQHDWPTEQAADKPDVQSLQEMREPYMYCIVITALDTCDVALCSITSKYEITAVNCLISTYKQTRQTLFQRVCLC